MNSRRRTRFLASALLAEIDISAAISKIEAVDVSGVRHEVWSGVDDMQSDKRGDHTWYVTKLEPAPYKVKAVRCSIAHAMSSSMKYVGAVQAVGE